MQDSRDMIHQLRCCQQQLEMQNEALHRAEKELVEVRDRFAGLYDLDSAEAHARSIIENCRDAFVSMDAQGNITDWNPEAERMFGFSKKEVVGTCLAEAIIPPELRVAHAEGLRHYLETGEHKLLNQHIEITAVHKNGSALPVELSITPLKVNHVITFNALIRDLTVRNAIREGLERSEQKAKKCEEQYRSLFENMQEVYYRLDVDGRIELISPYCLVQTGYRQDELLGRLLSEFFMNPAQCKQLLDELKGQGTVNDVEAVIAHKDGLPRTVSITSFLLLDADGQAVGIEGILRDISDRKRAEKAQQILLRENRALTRQLMQVQEEERRQLARDLHDELGQLLTSIDSRAEFIARHTNDNKLRTVAEEIVRDTKASFDASHATLLRLRPVTLDALGLVAALTELIEQWKKQAGIDCSLRIDGGIDHLDDMHAIAIYRLVQEGLTNAYRHGRADCVNVTIRSVPTHAGRAGQMQIEISDNGKGLHVEAVSAGMGIIGMRERVHALGGTFLLTHVPTDGMRVEAVLPVDDEEDLS